MPTYTFKNTNTQEIFDVILSMNEYDVYKSQHPNHERYFDEPPKVVSGVSTTNRVPDGFKEVLSKVSEAHPTSVVAQKHGKKSIKQIKTEQIVKKHLG
jgi:hypothetical protein